MAHRGPDHGPPPPPPPRSPYPRILVDGQEVKDQDLEHHPRNGALQPAPIDGPGPGPGPGPSQPGPGAPTQSRPLGKILRDCAKRHADANTNQMFWGYGLLRKLLTREQVRKELRKCGVAESLCDRIVPDAPPGRNQHRRKTQPAYLAIFALLVLTGKTKDIEGFLDKSELSDGLMLSVRLDLIVEVMDQCGWEDHDKDIFEHRRRGAMVPYFDTGEGGAVEVSPHQELPEGILLPWLEESVAGSGASATAWDKKGGFGSVTLHKIDPDSHSFGRLLDPVGLHSELVAVKCLNPREHPDEKAFHNEVDLLKRHGAQARQSATNPNDRAHRHIITLLATYQQGDKYCFVFPAADCDLDDYITKQLGIFEIEAPLDSKAATWLAEQIVGLMAAVNLLHRGSTGGLLDPSTKFTRHGDLKPENILWFRLSDNDRGIFVIGDLGLADIHGEHSRSNVPNVGLSTTMSYRAPESDIHNADISRAYDIWTLGCVFLEMIAWALGGSAMRQRFSAERVKTALWARTNMFFDISKTADNKFCFKVKDTVEKSILELHNMPSCTPFFHDLLDMISSQMLRVKPEDRKKSAPLLSDLEEMLRRGSNEASYFTERKPEKRHQRGNNKEEWVADALNARIAQAYQGAIAAAQVVTSTTENSDSALSSANHPIAAGQNLVRTWLLPRLWQLLRLVLGR